MKVKTKGTDRWYVEYDIHRQVYNVKIGGFKDSDYYLRIDALERVKELNLMEDILND